MKKFILFVYFFSLIGLSTSGAALAEEDCTEVANHHFEDFLSECMVKYALKPELGDYCREGAHETLRMELAECNSFLYDEKRSSGESCQTDSQCASGVCRRDYGRMSMRKVCR